jgi:hypothetical protein
MQILLVKFPVVRIPNTLNHAVFTEHLCKLPLMDATVNGLLLEAFLYIHSSSAARLKCCMRALNFLTAQPWTTHAAEMCIFTRHGCLWNNKYYCFSTQYSNLIRGVTRRLINTASSAHVLSGQCPEITALSYFIHLKFIFRLAEV